MPRYYNAKRGPLPLELNQAGSTIVPSKSFIEISREDEGSASVVRAVRKGLLTPPKIRPLAPAAPVAVAAPIPAPAIGLEPTQEASPKEESSQKPKSKRNRTRR